MKIAPLCPRCGDRLCRRYRYEEPSCPSCGYVAYHLDGAVQVRTPEYLEATGGRARFAKPRTYPALAEVVVSYRLRTVPKASGGVRLECIPRCPFPVGLAPACGLEMHALPPSGHRRARAEKRFACPEGHRISLVIDQMEGISLWW